VKLLRFLQLYPPPADAVQRGKLGEALTKVLTRTEVSESVNKSNADHAILFEAINLIIHQGEASDPALRSQAMTLLGRFIAVKEPNIRYVTYLCAAVAVVAAHNGLLFSQITGL
jgi:AP-2 complex subunit alpha